jgi:hypothetical protein
LSSIFGSCSCAVSQLRNGGSNCASSPFSSAGCQSGKALRRGKFQFRPITGRECRVEHFPPRFGCVVATLLCQEPRVFLAIRAGHALDVLEFPISQKPPCVTSHWCALRFQHRIVERCWLFECRRSSVSAQIYDSQIPAHQHLVSGYRNSRWELAPFYKRDMQIDDAWKPNSAANADVTHQALGLSVCLPRT